MKKIIAVYDISGIQDYIFSSNKLKENIGASIIIQKLFEDSLKESIILSKNHLKESIKDIDKFIIYTNWNECNELKILKEEDVYVEVLYIGGGNAWIAFKNKEIMKEVNKIFSKKVIEQTNGQIGIAVAYVETDFSNYNFDKKELFKKLKEKKNNMGRQNPVMGIGITREGITDGLPATHKYKNNEYISNSAFLKIKESKKAYFENKLLLNELSNCKFPKEFDDFGQEKEKSYIAVVHIDGNNMGKTIEEILKDVTEYKEAIKIMREFSKKIDKTFKDTMYNLLEEIKKSYKNENDKILLPIRPVVLNGDDVTFVCNGIYGIYFAELFLRKLKNNKINLGDKILELSACAGVAIVKTKFPFYKAYELSEKLCSNAKLKGKTLESNSIGNWLDFHILTNGIIEDLNEYRKKVYLKESNDEGELKKYNLLCRPYIVGDYKIKEYEIDTLNKIYKKFMEKPNNKIKELRNKFLETNSSLIEYINFLKSRGTDKNDIIPEIEGFSIEKLFNDENITPYFDALEVEYFYEKL